MNANQENEIWRKSFIGSLKEKRDELFTRASELALFDQVQKLQAMAVDIEGLGVSTEVTFAVEYERLATVLEGIEK